MSPLADREAVLFANEAFYRAFADRDIDAMDALWARGEAAELRRIARVEALQEEAARLLAAGSAGAAEPWFAEVARQLAATPGAGPGVARFQAMATDGYAAPDALALF